MEYLSTFTNPKMPAWFANLLDPYCFKIIPGVIPDE